MTFIPPYDHLDVISAVYARAGGYGGTRGGGRDLVTVEEED